MRERFRGGDRALPALALALVLGGTAPAGEVRAQALAAPDEVAEVQEVVDRLFDGMRTRDEAVLRSVWHPEARLQSAARDEAGAPVLRSTPVEGFIASVVASERHLDEVTFDEVVRISGDLATVWAPYNLFVDGEFSHCGIDAIQMIRSDDGWRIHQLTDTRTREGCDPDRRDGGE